MSAIAGSPKDAPIFTHQETFRCYQNRNEGGHGFLALDGGGLLVKQRLAGPIGERQGVEGSPLERTIAKTEADWSGVVPSVNAPKPLASRIRAKRSLQFSFRRANTCETATHSLIQASSH
jgi:hypothetical protein